MGFYWILWASSAQLHYPSSLGFMGLPSTPYFLSLLWACHDPFSLFHIIYCPWFAFSLFPSSFKPIYLLKAHLFISRAYDSCRLGLMGFLSICQLFSVCVAGLFLPTWASKMAINNVNNVTSIVHSRVILRGMHHLKNVEGLGAISAFS